MIILIGMLLIAVNCLWALAFGFAVVPDTTRWAIEQLTKPLSLEKNDEP